MRPPCRRRAPHSALTATDTLASKRAFLLLIDMLPPRPLSCSRETAALQPHDVAMNQTYLAAVPAIGFVQVWFSSRPGTLRRKDVQRCVARASRRPSQAVDRSTP